MRVKDVIIEWVKESMRSNKMEKAGINNFTESSRKLSHGLKAKVFVTICKATKSVPFLLPLLLFPLSLLSISEDASFPEGPK